MSVYIHLFHGRNNPEQQMDDWGFDGPVIGPLDYAHVTYMADIKFSAPMWVIEKFFPERAKEEREFQAQHYQLVPGTIDHDLAILDDMVVHDGKYYGDFSITSHPIDAFPEAEVTE